MDFFAISRCVLVVDTRNLFQIEQGIRLVRTVVCCEGVISIQAVSEVKIIGGFIILYVPIESEKINVGFKQ